MFDLRAPKLPARRHTKPLRSPAPALPTRRALLAPGGEQGWRNVTVKNRCPHRVALKAAYTLIPGVDKGRPCPNAVSANTGPCSSSWVFIGCVLQLLGIGSDCCPAWLRTQQLAGVVRQPLAAGTAMPAHLPTGRRGQL